MGSLYPIKVLAVRIYTKIVEGNCPKCEQGKIFSSRGNIFLLKAPKMNEKCFNCDYSFEREPGYFLGAFYVSYGMTVFELIVLYFILQFFIVNVATIIGLMLITLILLSFFNFRVSRLMWIQMFHK